MTDYPDDDYESPFTGHARPWPVSTPEPWEARLVNLGKRSNREKNRAWRRLTAQAPDVAAAIARDLPALRAHYPGAAIYVDASYLEADDG